MRRSYQKMFTEVRQYWPYYVLQSLAATVVIFAVLLILGLQEAVIIASIGSTVFIVFAMPNSVTAASRRIIGGHIVGLLCGYLCSFIVHSPEEIWFVWETLLYAFSVGLSMFLMVIVDCEHAPAAGTALGVSIQTFSWEVIITVIASAILLSLIRHYLRPWLHDLT